MYIIKIWLFNNVIKNLFIIFIIYHTHILNTQYAKTVYNKTQRNYHNNNIVMFIIKILITKI